MPVADREPVVGAPPDLARRDDVEHGQPGHRPGVVERHPVGDAAAAVVSRDREALVAERGHRDDEVRGERALAVRGVVGRGAPAGRRRRSRAGPRRPPCAAPRAPPRRGATSRASAGTRAAAAAAAPRRPRARARSRAASDVPLLEAREATGPSTRRAPACGTHIDHASVTRSSISARSIAASRTTSQLYRRSEVLGRTNFSGSASSAASRKSLGNPKPIIVSSRAIATNTIRPT